MNSAPEPSAAQRLVGDIAPKLAELTDEALAMSAVAVAKRVFAEDGR